ncbi:metallophosphoesterase family protein [Nonomuraea rhizosphaerae]|uniref:metallophosphoesterase family protein n=1 Tax=Nonomuraea rhizosphaerae TaxID=2665663 RepID=UPI001C602C24|nr:metallophosphoesterase [Nonomuraea rhizosphaerae]
MKFAIVGDIHANFAKADALVRRHAGGVEAIFSVGDAEPNRSEEESLGVAGPAKYRKVGDFPEFAAGWRSMSAPVYFIGGNHEPWPALDAQGAGEWAPGFHFLGRSGVREVGGLRVAFLSGIHSRHFSEPDVPPAITPERLKEYGYFTRPQVEELLRQARGKSVDLLLTHEWPSGLSYLHRGDTPVGRERVRELTDRLRPQVHACGHMHAPFRERVGNTDVICLSQVIHGTDAIAVLELLPDGTLKEVPLA